VGLDSSLARADVGNTVDDNETVEARADPAEHSARTPGGVRRPPGITPVRKHHCRDRLTGAGLHRLTVHSDRYDVRPTRLGRIAFSCAQIRTHEVT
jgi:hypothetical protein